MIRSTHTETDITKIFEQNEKNKGEIGNKPLILHAIEYLLQPYATAAMADEISIKFLNAGYNPMAFLANFLANKGNS